MSQSNETEPTNKPKHNIRRENGRVIIPPVIEYNGESGPVSYWANKIGISSDGLRRRLQSGWPVGKALTVPRTPNGTKMETRIMPDRRKPPEPGKPKFSNCSGCRYWLRQNGTGVNICNYYVLTGQLRTAYKGHKVERCPRNQTVADIELLNRLEMESDKQAEASKRRTGWY